MTLMLASVTNPAEAEAVCAGGADIVDLKDPAKGALGALDVTVAADIVRALGKKRPVSAAAGSPRGAPAAFVDAVTAMAAAASITSRLASRRRERRRLVRALAPQAKKTEACRGFFRRLRARFASLAAHGQQRLYRAMLDTAKKGAGRLLDLWTSPRSTVSSAGAGRIA